LIDLTKNDLSNGQGKTYHDNDYYYLFLHGNNVPERFNRDNYIKLMTGDQIRIENEVHYIITKKQTDDVIIRFITQKFEISD